MKPASLPLAAPWAAIALAVSVLLTHRASAQSPPDPSHASPPSTLPNSKFFPTPAPVPAPAAQPQAPPADGVVGYWRFGPANDPRHFELVVLNRDGEGSGFFIQPSTITISALTLKRLNPSLLICMWNDSATGAVYTAKGDIAADGAMKLQIQSPDGAVGEASAKASTWLPNVLPTYTGSPPGSDAAAERYQENQKRYDQERIEKQRQQDQWDQDRIDRERRAADRRRAEDAARTRAEERRRIEEADRRR